MSATQDYAISELTYQRRRTALDDGSEIAVSIGALGDSDNAHVVFSSQVGTLQCGALLTRAQLVAHRDAINAILAATEQA